MSPRVADELATADGVELVRIPGESSLLMLPENNPVFADPAVRRAVGLAVDREAIATRVFAGAAQPPVSPVSSTSRCRRTS
ncbi:MAG: ABC transporter substrate-binding protein [Pseudonocardia sp.]